MAPARSIRLQVAEERTPQTIPKRHQKKKKKEKKPRRIRPPLSKPPTALEPRELPSLSRIGGCKEEEGENILYQPRGEEAPGLRKKEGGVGEANSLVAASVYAEGGEREQHSCDGPLCFSPAPSSPARGGGTAWESDWHRSLHPFRGPTSELSVLEERSKLSS
ncbi:Neurogenic Locus Notch-like Protein 2 [Manis pentadactyla]|nr:Neurogenic Locus Notch-like Protein 2 [Manis pentadactyla]